MKAVGASGSRLLVVTATGLVSGAEVMLIRVVEAAIAAGWSVTAACPQGLLVGALERVGAQVRVIPELKLPAGPRALAGLRLAGSWVRAARTLRVLGRSADVVVANGLFVLPSVRLARPGRPVAWLVHDVLYKRSWSALLRLGGPVVTRAVAFSQAAAHPLKALGMDVDVISYGTPWPVEPIGDRPGAPPVIGCVAQLSRWKGQHVLLDAAGLLPKNVRIELVGGTFPKDEGYAETLRRRAGQPDLEGRVEFLGRLDDAKVRMRTWTAAVSASIEPEAGPLVVLEAMSLGLPVVGTNHGGTAEFLGGAGLLVPPGDSEALADALERLLNDRDLWARCHATGPRRIEEGELTLARQTDDILAWLAALAEEEPAGRR